MENKNIGSCTTSTLIVNLVAGPGAGKSTTAADVFASLKRKDINVELITEFAKDLTWAKDFHTLGDQYYVSMVQHYRQYRVAGQVDVMVTDSPLIVGLLYYIEPDDILRGIFEQFVSRLYKNQNNLTYFIKRKKKYNPKGRTQSEQEAIQKDIIAKNLLDQFNIPYKIIEGTLSSSTNMIVEDVLTYLKDNL